MMGVLFIDGCGCFIIIIDFVFFFNIFNVFYIINVYEFLVLMSCIWCLMRFEFSVFIWFIIFFNL